MPPISADTWITLELVKLIVSVLTPLSVALIGWFISRRLKRHDLVQWSNQKLIEKRLEVYDTIAPHLNRLLCFYTWVGTWKSTSPADVIRTKRELDQAVHVYRYLFDDKVFAVYQEYMNALFDAYTGPGHDAKIRSHVTCKFGDRTSHCDYAWDPAWADRFKAENVPDREVVRAHHHAVMESLRESLGVR